MKYRIETIVINFKEDGPSLNAVVVSEHDGFVGRRSVTLENTGLANELEALALKSIIKSEEALTVTLERPVTRLSTTKQVIEPVSEVVSMKTTIDPLSET